jgi:N-carbamoylputrescine amidase
MKVAVAQLAAEAYDAERNRSATVDAVTRAFDDGADVVVLPELSVTGYSVDRERLLPLAETLDGPTVSTWRDVAQRAGGIVVGGFCEAADGGIYNSAVAVGENDVLMHYRKAHLFGAEKHCFLQGNLGFPVARTAVGTLGLCICYDLRFVETVRLLALRGAELICVPTAWVTGFDAERWDADGLCPQARAAILQANLSQVYIACASQTQRSNGFEFLGSSIIVDAWGKLAAGPVRADATGVVAADIDISGSVVARDRGGLVTPRDDRRTDLYGIWADGVIL